MDVVIAIITGLSVAVPSIMATILSNKKTTALLEYKVDELTDHVNKHNNLIDRMYKIENRVTLLEEGKHYEANN